MTVQATFSFQDLKFERQSDEIFTIDQKIEDLRRKSVQEHYKNLQDKSARNYSLNTDEDTRRQNQTLSRLYQQLGDMVESEEEAKYGSIRKMSNQSSCSDNVAERYNQMMEDDNDLENSLIKNSNAKQHAMDMSASGDGLKSSDKKNNRLIPGILKNPQISVQNAEQDKYNVQESARGDDLNDSSIIEAIKGSNLDVSHDQMRRIDLMNGKSGDKSPHMSPDKSLNQSVDKSMDKKMSTPMSVDRQVTPANEYDIVLEANQNSTRNGPPNDMLLEHRYNKYHAAASNIEE